LHVAAWIGEKDAAAAPAKAKDRLRLHRHAIPVGVCSPKNARPRRGPGGAGEMCGRRNVCPANGQ
jgi:hypothetical protein